MIVVDANVFQRALISPLEPYNRWMCDEAIELFRQTAEGTAQLLTSSAVIAEVAFLLTSRNVYGYDVKESVERLETVLNIPSLHLDRKADTLRALRLWAERPSMGFVDALVVAMAESMEASLASFDTELRRFTWIARHRWRSEPSSDG
ncbi:MAG: type II toxin-antitoxin system VapC family toxin [Chloroflexia bacterium]|nr:type II toxin-antitoxin system VapC family toxin [Chloroflexia bacterium]